MYLTDSKTIDYILESVNITLDELESYVGRFRADHWRFPGLLKGEAIVTVESILIRHHFTKKKIVTFDI